MPPYVGHFLGESSEIDIAFDFRTDANGRDPDSHSPTLRKYHQLLWSKELPGGAIFGLCDEIPGVYLHHRSSLGEFRLSSDSVMQTFVRWNSLQHITRQLSDGELEAFFDLGYTIGGMMVFPGNRIDGKQTINGARGFRRAISDRFDLTLESIRRYYVGGTSPLSDTLQRYGDFFELFDDFEGYVDFFLLQDLVDINYRVRFFMPFDDFRGSALPRDVDLYRMFRERSVEFIRSRNARISKIGL